MNCQQVQESLGDHSVGLLDEVTLVAFEQHMAICAECARSFRQFQRCIELLNHATLPPPSKDLWSGIHMRLELDRTVNSYSQAPYTHAGQAFDSRRWLPSAMAAMAGFATAALIMIGLTGARDGGTAAMASVPPVAVSVSQHNSLESSSPVADGASVVAVDAVTLRPMSVQPGRHQTVLPGREIFGEPATPAQGAIPETGDGAR